MASGAVKPVITWTDGQFTIRSGISWVTLFKNSHPEERLRLAGREELFNFASLLIDGVCAVADKRNVDIEKVVGSRRLGFKWQADRRRPEISGDGTRFYSPPANDLRELADWLIFVTGGCRGHSCSAPFRVVNNNGQPLLHFIPSSGCVNFALSASMDELAGLQQRLLTLISSPQIGEISSINRQAVIDGALLSFSPGVDNGFVALLRLDKELAKCSDITRPMLAKLALQIDQLMEGSDA